MCTLTIVPTENGYLAAMNRDELLTRPQAMPDLAMSCGDVRFVAPQEASGGTWIAGNDRGDVFGLLNGNPRPAQRNRASLVSRGTVIPQLIIKATDAASLETHLNRLPLEFLAPFRLIAAFRKEPAIVESSWNGKKIKMLKLPWARGHWFSSSASDEIAARERGETCELAAKRWPAGTSWLRRLHRSHVPGAGPFSVCVHRPDAATVSYTEVHVDYRSMVMNYLSGNPCQKEEFDSRASLPLVSRHWMTTAS
jgi:hypothetical protein